MFTEQKLITYSNLLGLTVEELNSFIKRYKNYLLSKETMTPDNMDNYLSVRLEGLSLKTQINYVRILSSTVQGLSEANITLGVDKSYFDTKVQEIKTLMPRPTIRTDRAIKNVNTVIYKTMENTFVNDRYEECVNYNFNFFEV